MAGNDVIVQGNIHAPLHFHQGLDARKEFLKSLCPEVTTARYYAISNTKYKSFEWVFDDVKMYQLCLYSQHYESQIWMSKSEKAKLDAQSLPDKWKGSLTTWLQSSNDIFVIVGKPGAGKSTLMKFIATHSRTTSILQANNSDKAAIVLFHGFWLAGQTWSTI